jgi:transcriptional regulator with XRE-family HTH domain
MESELRHIFAQRIRKLRESHGLNQGEFADTVGVSRGAMSYYEQEARTPDIEVLRRICAKYGIPADYMIGLIPDPDREVSDVCLQTGLWPEAVKRLRLIRRIKAIKTREVLETIVGEFADDDVEAAVWLTPFSAAPLMANVLLATDEGLHILNLLSAIICGAELVTGSDEPPMLRLPQAHSTLEISYPVGSITGALWANIQENAAELRNRLAKASAGEWDIETGKAIPDVEKPTPQGD